MTTIVQVFKPNRQTIESVKEVKTTVVSRPGTKGEKGDDGAPGSVYEHQQPIAASEWICNHNLGFRPNVQIFSIGGVEAMAEVLHISVNQARIYFDTPFAGFAVFS